MPGLCCPARPGLKLTRVLWPAALAALLGSTTAGAQDRANSSPFTASAPYVGRVLSNSSTINNNAAAPGWQGNVVSNSNTINNNAGATWTGDIESNAETINNFAGASWYGSVRNQNDLKNFGTWTGDVLANVVKLENGVGATWYGDVYDNQHKFLNYGTWIGDLYAQVSTGELNSYGDWIGDVIGNAGTIYADGIWTGDVRSNSYRIVTNLLDPTSTETLWDGDVLTNDGTIINYINGTWQGDVVDNAGYVSNYSIWNGNLTNRGRVSNIGVWTGNVLNTGALFTARNQFIGDFDNRGAVQLTGDLAISGALSNSGRLQLTQTTGSQTLTVGSLALSSTSSYEIDVDSAGATDRLVVNTSASLAGTVIVTAATTGGPYPSPTATYAILSASSISGTFSGVSTDLAFFSPHLSYDASTVYLAMQRNNVGFATTGSTANQRSVGATVEALGAGQPLFEAVLWLTPEETQRAFDQLSGEGYESARSAAILNAAVIRGVVLSRLDQSFDALGDTGTAVSRYAAVPEASGRRGEMDVWGQIYGAGASLNGDGLANLASSAGGLVMGVDGMLNDWRLGGLVQVGASGNDVAALNTQTSSADYGVGLYAGTEWGNTRLSLGGTLTIGDTHSSRSVSFPGFSDRLTGAYSAATTQGFVELSHKFEFGGLSATPFAGLAQVFQTTEGFAEQGGAAALTRSAGLIDATFATLGFRLSKSFVVGGDMLLTADGALGWRHAFADAPSGSAALVGGGTFVVVGTPVVPDVVLFSAGLSLDVDAATSLAVHYDGEAGTGEQAHAFRARLAKQF